MTELKVRLRGGSYTLEQLEAEAQAAAAPAIQPRVLKPGETLTEGNLPDSATARRGDRTGDTGKE